MRIGNKLVPAAVVAALAVAVLLAWAPRQSAAPQSGQPAAKGASAAAAGQSAPKGQVAPPPRQFALNRLVVKVGADRGTAADVELASQYMPSEIQDEAYKYGRQVIGKEYVRMLTLAQQARKDRLDQSADFQRHVKLWEIQWLAEAEFKKLNEGIKVTPEAVKQYYDAHISDFAQIQVQGVSLRKKLANAPASPGFSDEEAMAKAEEIRHALESGQSYAQVAETYKKADVIYFDAHPRTIRHGTYPAAQEDQWFALKDGQLTATVDEPGSVSFMQVVSHSTAPFSDVQNEIEIGLHNRQLTGRVDDLKKERAIWMDPVYFAPLHPGQKDEDEDGGGR